MGKYNPTESNELKLPKKITGHFHPTVIVAPISGKTYIVPDWIEVPQGTTIDDVMKIWVKGESINKNSKTQIANVYRVLSSNKVTNYKVTELHGVWSCTCSGYGFRRKCSHIDQIKNK